MRTQLHQLTLIAAGILVASTADASSPNTPIHGPEGNAVLDMSRCFTIYVQPGQTLRLHFNSSAYYENEAIVYDQFGSVAARKGNYGLGLDSWSWYNDTGQTRFFIVSGWHKNGPYPSSHLPWWQSPIRTFEAQPTFGAVGFEDSNDNNYNDVVVRYQIQ